MKPGDAIIVVMWVGEHLFFLLPPPPQQGLLIENEDWRQIERHFEGNLRQNTV